MGIKVTSVEFILAIICFINTVATVMTSCYFLNINKKIIEYLKDDMSVNKKIIEYLEDKN